VATNKFQTNLIPRILLMYREKSGYAVAQLVEALLQTGASRARFPMGVSEIFN
jgi:hypothetical protein